MLALLSRQRRHQVAEGEAVGEQFVGMRRDVILLHEAADGVDLNDAGHVAQLRLDDPILHRAQVGRRDLAAVGVARAGLGFDVEHVDFAEAGGDRAERWLDAGRQFAFRLPGCAR